MDGDVPLSIPILLLSFEILFTLFDIFKEKSFYFIYFDKILCDSYILFEEMLAVVVKLFSIADLFVNDSFYKYKGGKIV